jgi:hypothetical protein
MTKINILLDIDNTLLCSQDISSFNIVEERNKTKYNKLEKHTIKGYYEVFERPYLKEFLTFIFKNFNVFIWTAASDEYAEFVITNIIKNKKKIKSVLHSEHCDKSSKYSKTRSIKDLSLLWDGRNKLGLDEGIIKMFRKDNTIILDDYKEEVYIKNKSNCILAPAFDYENDECYKDTFLLKLKNEIEKLISKNYSNERFLEKILYNINPKNTRVHKSGSGKHGKSIKKSIRKSKKKSIKSRSVKNNTYKEKKESISRITKILENIRKSNKRVVNTRKSRR